MSASLNELRVIMRALLYLPERCKYHGDDLIGRDVRLYDGACCATGEPALARRRGFEALQRLTAERDGVTP